jgi:hypothetical protein
MVTAWITPISCPDRRLIGTDKNAGHLRAPAKTLLLLSAHHPHLIIHQVLHRDPTVKQPPVQLSALIPTRSNTNNTHGELDKLASTSVAREASDAAV